MNQLEDCTKAEDNIVVEKVRLILSVDKSIYWLGAILLAGLTDEYEPMIMSIKSSNTKVNAEIIKLKVLDMNVKTNTNGDCILQTSAGTSKNYRQGIKNFKCYTCGGRNYKSSECRLNETENQPQKESKKLNETIKHAFVAIPNLMNSITWFIDSGASSHMTPHGNILCNTRKHSADDIVIADNTRIKIDSVGNAIIKADNQELTTHDMLRVPKLSANLLLVSKMVQKDNTVIFDKQGCTVYSNDGNVIANTSETDGVYKLDRNTTNYMVKMRNGLVNGVKFNSKHLNFCEVYAKAKQHRLPFTCSNSRSENVLDTIHADLCGQMENSSIGGSRYFLLFIDDYSRKVFVYFLKNKSETLNIFIDFKVLVENQTGQQMALCVNFQTSKVIKRAKCMLLDANLEKAYWAEAANMAVYIINRSPTGSLKERTPEEAWSGKKADITDLKIFGSTVMVHIPKEKCSKWDSKSSKLIFVGYADNKKGYRCLDPSTKKITITQDILFHEDEKEEVKERVRVENPDKHSPAAEENIEASVINTPDNNQTNVSDFVSDNDEQESECEHSTFDPDYISTCDVPTGQIP
ncbi:hypothetical protein Trydic_g1660 [Trypoxylus dichotomus]